MLFSRKKPNLAPANRLTSQSQPEATQQQQHSNDSITPQSQSHSQSSQQKQQSQPIYPWSAHSPFGQSPSPFPRDSHALSTSATAAGELYLFGGYVYGSKTPSNDLYVISTLDFSTTLLKTSGDVPSPRFGHRAVLTSNSLLIWGGVVELDYKNAQNWKNDDSFYLLNLVSREWTRIVVHGPGPNGRDYHTLTLVGTKLFVFGGGTAKRCFNDIWALDLNSLKSNPFWESYEPAPGNEKPLPRANHVSATTCDRIIIFGGRGDQHDFNDTWSFNVSTRKWTKLQCTGSIPSPRSDHATVLVGDVMYVFGGIAIDGTILGDLAALNLSTQQWTAFKDIGSSPCGRWSHTMASDGGRVFVLGGILSRGTQANEAKLIHVLDTNLLNYPKPDFNTVEHSEKITKLAQKLPAGHPIQGQPEQTLVAKTERDRRIAELTDDLAQKSALLEQAEKEKKGARLELRELQAKLDESLLSRDHALKQAEANAAAEEKKRAGLELRKLQAKLDESLLSRDRALQQAEANAGEERKRAGLELRELQAKLVALDESLLSRDHALQRAGLELYNLQVKLDESLLSRDHALEQARNALQNASCGAAEANQQNQREVTEMRANLEASKSELAAFRLRLADTEIGYSKSKVEADTNCNQTVTGLVNTDEDRVVHRLMERVQAMEAEMASLRWNEKSFDMMECRNEG